MRTRPTEALSAQTCKEITDLIVGYLRDELSPNIRRDFRQHLRICPDCASFLNTYKKTVASTRSLRAQDLPAAVRKNILDFLRARKAKEEAE
jgi:anti-sigma factor RsiW